MSTTTATSTRATLARHRDLVYELLIKEFKVRYKSTVLGYLWSILNPLAFVFVYYFVFKVITRWGGADYAMLLVTALFPWQWFQNSLTASNGFFLSNASLLKKVSFPRSFLVLTGVLNDVVHFVVSIPVIAVFLLFFKDLPAGDAPVAPAFSWLWQLPLLIAIQFGLTYGFALVLATANLFFRDLERLVGIFVTLWFWMTPIIYEESFVIERGYGWLLVANPLAVLVGCWRRVFIEGVLPLDMAAIAAVWAVAVTVVGTLYYRRVQWRFAEIV